jgi:hypothetical protein
MFAEIEKEAERRKKRIPRFSAKSEILIITIPTAIHELCILHLEIWAKPRF